MNKSASGICNWNDYVCPKMKDDISRELGQRGDANRDETIIVIVMTFNIKLTYSDIISGPVR